METEIIRAWGDAEKDAELLRLSGRIISEGGLAAIPTETVYGLAGDALNPDSARRIYEAKGRPSDNPLIVHIARLDSLEYIISRIPEGAMKLFERFWPGPLTVVMEKSAAVPGETTGGLDTVAVRMPVHPIALEFIAATGGYIAAPSANRSGRPSCTNAAHVMEDMGGRIPLIIDGGEVGIGLESTIVDLSGERPVLLRPGYITVPMLEEALGREVLVDRAVDGVIDPDIRPRAPGMKYTHYAPRARMYIVRGSAEKAAERIAKLAEQGSRTGSKTAVIACDETRKLYGGLREDIEVISVGSREKEETIAHNLFNVLRRMDEMGAELVYSEAFYTPRLGNAIMNRLTRAAGHRFIDV